MSFENPVWLALLVALPVLWLLHRRMRGPLVLRVSSLLPFQGDVDVRAESRPRRQLDVSLWLLLVAAGCLALAAAGPVVDAVGRGVYVVVDTSASMDARLAGGERSVRDDALARARALVGGAEVLVRPLADASAAARGWDAPPLPGPGADGLPGSLATHLEQARAGGFPGLLLVTDRALSVPGVVVVGPSAPAGPNVGIADVVLDGDEMIVSLRSSAAEDIDAVVEAPAERRVRVPGGGVASVRLPAPAVEAAVRLRPGDSQAADDAVVVARTGGARLAHLEGAPGRVLPALRACGVEPSGTPESDVIVRGGHLAKTVGGPPVLHFAAAPGSARGVSVSSGAAGPLRGGAVQGRGALDAGLPSAAATLVATGRIDGGEPVLLDAEGALAVWTEGALITCLDPDDPASTWHEEPSFVVFVAAALERLVGRERLAVSGGVPASEIRVASAAVDLPGPGEVAALERTGGGGNGLTIAPWLALLAAACTLGAVLAGRTRRIPVLSWGRDRAR